MYFQLGNSTIFPDPEKADDDGLIAFGGDLSTKRLLSAYKAGIFPWFNELPVLWWSPNPRFVLHPENLKISKSMRKILKSNHFEITADTDFENVISKCSQINRKNQDGTWITKDIISAYIELHREGYAHSIESKINGETVGGLYGISLGRAFFGESMFSEVSNASKAAFIMLVNKLQSLDFHFIDAQVYTPHLESLGAKMIPRKQFLKELNLSLQEDTINGSWNNLFNNFKTSSIFQ